MTRKSLIPLIQLLIYYDKKMANFFNTIIMTRKRLISLIQLLIYYDKKESNLFNTIINLLWQERV